MKCKEIQDLIMTDYGDRQMDEESRKTVAAHIAACPECRGFEQAFQKVGFEPFAQARKEKAPEAIWTHIKAGIEQEQAGGQPARLRRTGTMRELIRFRRPAFALATVAATILVVFLIARQPHDTQYAVNGYLEDQAEFLTYLGGGEGDVTAYNGNGYVDFGTDIERYFF